MRESALRPEHEVLLVAARAQHNANTRARLLELAARDIDWLVVGRTAVRHGIAPLIFHSLTTAGAVAPDDGRVAPLWECFAANAGNSLILAQQLVDVMTLLEERQIPAVAYKGPALAAALYGNLALREFTDLDVLVRWYDARNASEVLISGGYQPEVALTPAAERALVQSSGGYFRRYDRALPAGRVALELHWRIPATFSLDESFWDRLQPVRLLGRDVLHFTPEDLVLILCAHGFKHGWSTLKWVCDVAELVATHRSLDWERALERASRAGGLRVLLLGCALARASLGADLPRVIVDRIAADPVVGRLAAEFLVRLLDEHNTPHVGVINNLRIRERIHDRIRYGFALVDALTARSALDAVERPAERGTRLFARVIHPFRAARRVANKHRA